MQDAPATDEEIRPIWPVLALAVATLVLSPFIFGLAVGPTIVTVLIGATALIALRRSGARPRVILAGDIALGAAVVVSIIVRTAGESDDRLAAVASGIYCLLLLVTPIVVVVRLSQRPRITLDTLAGLLAAYIQIGLFFSSAYQFTDLVGSEPFFQETSDAGFMDFQFFSFTTLTTLGYGNLVPRSDVGQMLAVVQAIFGQVFLVTVVALAVSNLGTESPARRRRAASSEIAAEPSGDEDG